VRFSKKNFWRGFLVAFSGLGILASSLFYSPKQTQALEWYERLIDNAVFINKDAMTLQQIQDFLVSKGSYLANYRMSWGGVNRTASEWIYYEAQEHGINPQVIIVTLQKEERLITLANPSQTRLDWAMGYGAYSGCNPDGSWCTQYAGFGAQIHYAASWYRSKFEAGGVSWRHVGQTVSIQTRFGQPGYTSVYLSNSATAVLYVYTPYIYDGNYNFYNLFRNWFGSGMASVYLWKANGGDGKVYLVINGRRYWINDPDTFNHWGFSWSNITDVDPLSLSNYPEGNSIKRVVQDGAGRNYYVVSGQKRLILNQAAAQRFGIDISSPSSLPDDVLNLLSNGDVLASLLKSSSGAVYLIDDLGKHHIINPRAFEFWNFSWADIASASDPELSNMTASFDVSYVMKGGDGKVYLIDQNTKHHIRDPLTFNGLGFNWSDIRTATDSWLNSLSTGNSLWLLVKSSSRPEVYLVDSGTKHHIPDPFHFQLWGFRWEDVATLSDNAIDQISTGANVTFLVKGSGSAVYFMDSGYKHWIINPSVFSDWGFRWDQIRTYSDDLVNTIWTGAPMTSLLKGSAPAVYLIENGYKHWLPNLDVFNRWRLNGTDIRPYSDLLVNAVYTGTPLSHLVKASNGRVYLVENGKRRWITSPRAFQNRGYKWSDVRTLPDSLINRLPEGQRIR
jgi:hypothetical protein